MISKAMNAKLNEQITHEFHASQIYLAMACQFEQMGLKMLAKHFRAQTAEERDHALKILDYVQEVGGIVRLEGIPAPAHEYPSVPAALEASLGHEHKVTRQIHDIVALADRENDYATRSFMKWFVDEQVEEVGSMEYLVQVAKMAGQNLLHLESVVARIAKNQ